MSKTVKTLLVNPQAPSMVASREFYVPPSLVYLAGFLDNRGYEVRILDLNVHHPYEAKQPINFCFDVIAAQLEEQKPHLIGFSCLFSGQWPSVMEYACRTRNAFPEIKIVVGGLHPTIYAREILENCPFIDFVVLGEGEETLLSLVEQLSQDSVCFHNLDGFGFRIENKVIVNEKKKFISNPDTIPLPAYHLLDLEKYFHNLDHWHNPKKQKIRISIPIISSRSCPKKCSFCSMFHAMGPKWRNRSSGSVVDEIQYLYEKYEIRHFTFMDDNFTFSRLHAIDICKGILQRRMDLQFETLNGVAISSLDEEVLDVMVAAGLKLIALPIESGSDYIRNSVMKKGLSKEKIMEIVRLTKKYPRLLVRAYFILGMAEDTEETIMETYKMIEEIGVNECFVNNLLPFPGTQVFNQAMRDKLLIEDIDPAQLWKMDCFYLKDNKQFFLKPYRLTLSQLRELRKKLDELTEKTKRSPGL